MRQAAGAEFNFLPFHLKHPTLLESGVEWKKRKKWVPGCYGGGTCGGIRNVVCGYALGREWMGTQRRKMNLIYGPWAEEQTPDLPLKTQPRYALQVLAAHLMGEQRKFGDLCCAPGSLVQCSWLHNDLHCFPSLPQLLFFCSGTHNKNVVCSYMISWKKR